EIVLNRGDAESQKGKAERVWFVEICISCCGSVSRPCHPLRTYLCVNGDLRSDRWHGRETVPQQSRALCLNSSLITPHSSLSSPSPCLRGELLPPLAHRRGDQVVTLAGDDFAGHDLARFQFFTRDVDDSVDVRGVGVGAADEGVRLAWDGRVD